MSNPVYLRYGIEPIFYMERAGDGGQTESPREITKMNALLGRRSRLVGGVNEAGYSLLDEVAGRVFSIAVVYLARI